MRFPFRLIASAALFVALLASGARAELHALIIGIDDYAHEQRLAGAVADANDIEAAVKKLQPKSVTVLRNADASRARIEQAWTAMIASAQPGDTVIFTYAGHGGREPWKSSSGRSETAEAFLLQRFRSPLPSQDSAERILGKQLKVWFRKAYEAKQGQLRIIFVADSCHAGGMTRSADPRAEATYRSTAYEIPDAPISISARDEAASADLAHVTFIAATQADKKIPEVVINGRKRGALSYAFARALEGHASQQGRGSLTNLDLQAYITRSVRQISEAQQTPEFQFRSGGENETVLSNIPKRIDFAAEPSILSLRIDNAEQGTREALNSNLVGVRIVDKSAADMIWDAKDGTVLSGIGDTVAEQVKAATLQGVVDKWRVLPALKTMVQKNPLDVRLSPSDGRHPRGKALAFRTAPLPHKFLTVFNLASDGTVQFVYPLPPGDPANGERDIGKLFSIDLGVKDPFGADHAVFISSTSSLHVLNGRLRAAPRTIDLPKLLTEALPTGGFAIGMQSLYTTGKP